MTDKIYYLPLIWLAKRYDLKSGFGLAGTSTPRDLLAQLAVDSWVN